MLYRILRVRIESDCCYTLEAVKFPPNDTRMPPACDQDTARLPPGCLTFTPTPVCKSLVYSYCSIFRVKPRAKPGPETEP